jgi:hypothetical protein
LDIFENGTAEVSGIALVKVTDKDSEYEAVDQSSNVFINRNGEWQAINSHV